MPQDCLLTSINVKATPYFHLLASISALNGMEEGAGWWTWEDCPGRGEPQVGGLEGAVEDPLDLSSSIRVLKIILLILTRTKKPFARKPFKV